MANVCVIGAGSSGIAACQVLQARGIDFDCVEKGSSVGGNWRYRNDNGMSAAYESLQINTSRRIMEYASFPMPDRYPDYPHHRDIAEYFDAFVDRFGLRERIRFSTEVTGVEREGEGWRVSFDDGSSESYEAILVANGHHWNPKWPDYAGEFTGDQIHAHEYRTWKDPVDCEGKNVLVVGGGNSGMDIAVETSRHAAMTFSSMRRGYWVIPKYMRGRPVDELGNSLTTRLPLAIQRRLYLSMLKTAAGLPEQYGLPKPDHQILESHPTVSSDFLPRVGHGRITIRPDIERLDGNRVRFVDCSEQAIDVIIWCTGYRLSFPFFDENLLRELRVEGNRIPLYQRVIAPEHPSLAFLGFIQPLGAIMPIAERQAEWMADLLDGSGALPPRDEMETEIRRYYAALDKRYVSSTRHTFQVDFQPYMRDLARERKACRKRRGAPTDAVAA